jgi:O-antigen ligase
MTSVLAPTLPHLAQQRDEREAVLLREAGWLTAARLVLWTVIVTASVKPIEILGLGEQIKTEASSPIDLAFRVAVFAGCVFATFIALMARRIRLATLWFVPFLVWAILVAIGQQSSLSSSKQIASYATWILFFISATALFDRPDDDARLRIATTLSVVTTAIGGAIQHALGNAPMIGQSWNNIGFTRIHTGSGGILLDAGAPFIAALLCLAASVKRPIFLVAGILLALWGSGNILRGGMTGFSVALVWLLIAIPKGARRRLFLGACGVVVLVALVFGSKIMQKSVTDDDELNTSGRIENWPQLLGWIREDPIWGHGPNADMELLKNSEGSDLRVSHNELLSTTVNYGIVGTVLLWGPMLLLLLCTLRLAYHYRAATPDPLLGAGAVLILLVILSFTDNTLRTPGIMILALSPLPVAFNWCFRRLAERDRQTSSVSFGIVFDESQANRRWR